MLRATSTLSSLLLLTACASGPAGKSLTQVGDMNVSIERMHAEAEQARKAVAQAFQKLDALASGKFEGASAATAFVSFVQSIDAAEQQARRFRDVVGPMVDASKPVFRDWQDSVASIDNERLRQRSEQRLGVAKERFAAITTAAAAAQDSLDSYVRALRDHAAFLANDLNAGAIGDIKDEVRLVGNAVKSLDRSMQTCQTAARAYVDQAAMPASPAAAPAR
jgi:hypothetical protein